ncbi:MFS transporter [Dermabacter sp. p3-SID358]|uniref:MFS transporter n=1 Tax=Dermabacter sp. p3-SID358 TaxID=2916114 RepID=UPI0021A93AEC|nr:MFS transporter [Dermabacter sp. p3-SID358]MCT1867104.1 MFS transporter [Dermabacter sp. p3-SID358]
MNLSPDAPASHRGGARRNGGTFLLVVLCIPMFLVLLDVLAMNVAMPTVGRTFHVPVARWAQVVDAYTVPLALALLPAGWLVDRIGPRRALLVGITVFTAASVVGGLAGAWLVVLGARLGQGLAAAVMLPAGLAALSTSWPEPHERARALGAWSSISAVATALGPAVGGLLVAAMSWRAVFWVNVPLGLVAAWGTWQQLGTGPRRPQQPQPEQSGRGAIATVSLVGSVIAAAMMTSGANGTLQVITVHLQSGLGMGAGPTGLLLLLATAPFVVLGPLSGRAVVRLGRRRVAALGFAVGAVGLATLGRLPGTMGLAPGLLGIGVGLGLMTSAIVGESLSAWPGRPGVASGLNNALRQTGTSLGVALGGWAAGWWSGTPLLVRTGAAAGLWWVGAAVLVLVTFTRSRRSRKNPR